MRTARAAWIGTRGSALPDRASAPCLRLAAAAMLLAGLAAPAPAHHSYAMFDLTRKTSVQGTVAKFEWTQPHVFLWVYVPQPGSAQRNYALFGFEGGSPGTLERNGWRKETFAAGEKVTVEFMPLKDGRPGGSLMRVTHADGSVSVARAPEAPAAGGGSR